MIPALLLVMPLSATVAEARGLHYLAREVPQWSAENKCYSCHNNGDAARALCVAQRLHFTLPAKTLDDTLVWLTKPAGWHKNGGDVEFKDDALARIQFAATLVEALQAGLLKDKAPLLTAAELIVKDHHRDGCWQGGFPGDVGSPVTYGAPLATWQAREVLRFADARKYGDAIARADRWLLQAPVERVLDAAVVLHSLHGRTDRVAVERRQQCLATLRKGQSKDGGWGPFVNSSPEVFDTAIVVLALASAPPDSDTAGMLRRGRAWLVREQKADGSWPETTRPTGGDSYAQRLSTTGWAMLALLSTRAGKP
ncbi:MAG: hypothetical protein JNM56_02465 [Planctomycetia bacterium]|nr:hypothetical protein [Planctomycetia bacterium]